MTDFNSKLVHTREQYQQHIAAKADELAEAWKRRREETLARIKARGGVQLPRKRRRKHKAAQ